MEKFALIKVERLSELLKLSTAELKMFFVILNYLNSKDKKVLVHNAEFREFMASMGFSKTPERISTILSSMVKKGVLIREGQGVYSVPGNIFLPDNDCKE